MKKTQVYCDACQQEVSYYLIPRYCIDEQIRDILRRHVIDIEHLCEPCMKGLDSELNNAVGNWKTNYMKERSNNNE